MKLLKLILTVLFALVAVLYGITALNTRLSGKNVGPSISCDSEVLDISVNDPEDVLYTGITASDKQDGDLTEQVRVLGISKLVGDNTAKVTYLVFDSDDNMDSHVRYIRYTDYQRPRYAIRQPLVYSMNEPIALLDRLQVTDVLDGDITQSVRVSTLAATSDSEVYTVSLQVTNSMGDTARVTLPVIMQEGTAHRPQVRLSDYLVYLNAGSSFNAQQYLSAVSVPGGDGSLTDVQITSTVDVSTPGTYMVYYRYPYNGTVGLAILTVVVQ